ncbi:GSCOCT00013095001.2-RA-CDS [Cotesia congregata]|uniref:Cc_bv6.23_32.23 n=1 Tax=Cotesia congregata TaxID=51543 RepID=S6CWK6_COTCN|nr:GSCOCT00013095001.2-RA-CDS [Cotesia congregata]CAG5092533.1 cc_bv6.23_32.23 [Cotesia congregata]CCQ71255.1 hypothetical protein BV6-23 [Cotesia congregata]
MPCPNCKNNVTTHKNIYVVPREWQTHNFLECALWKIHSNHYRTYKTTKSFRVYADGITARLENYSNYLWLRKTYDFAEKPDPKKYFSAYVACIYCNNK